MFLPLEVGGGRPEDVGSPDARSWLSMELGKYIPQPWSVRFLHGRSGWPKSGHFQAFVVLRIAESFEVKNVPVCPGPGPGRGFAAWVRAVVFRISWFGRMPAPSVAWPSPELACGVAGASRRRLRTWSGPGLPHSGSPCRGQVTWPSAAFPGQGVSGIPCVPGSGFSAGRTPAVLGAWLRPPPGLARLVALVPWPWALPSGEAF